MDAIFTDDRFPETARAHLTFRGYRCDVGGITVMAMPPGKVDLDIHFETAMVNVVPYMPAPSTDPHYRLNGENREPATCSQGGTTFLGGGSDLSLRCENPEWELLLELQPQALERIAVEQSEHIALDRIDMAGGIDQTAGILARLAIEHLRHQFVDRLYLEGLATAITARTLGFAAPQHTAPSTQGTDRRIDRAIDYIHAHLVGGLSVAELAGIACMSPSWFSRAFKAHTGLTVHAYVLEQRLEQAHFALLTTGQPIATIAWTCGFADHAHLTRLFKRRYGMTPSAFRAQ